MSDYAIPEETPTPGCKVCGKTGEAMPRRGPYANRCASCRREVADRMRAGGRTGGAKRGRRGMNDESDDSFEAKAKTLVSHGRRVDQALADVRVARARTERREDACPRGA